MATLLFCRGMVTRTPRPISRVCVVVCICMYVYIYIKVYIYIICIYIYICIHIYIYMSGTSSQEMDLRTQEKGHPEPKPNHDSTERQGAPTYYEYNTKKRSSHEVSWSVPRPSTIAAGVQRISLIQLYKKWLCKALVTNHGVKFSTESEPEYIYMYIYIYIIYTHTHIYIFIYAWHFSLFSEKMRHSILGP